MPKGWERLAQGGGSSDVWRVETPAGPLIARFWSTRTKRKRAQECVHLLELLKTLGVRAPRHLGHDASAATKRNFGLQVVFEEVLTGRPFTADDLGDPNLRARLVDILVRLHAASDPVGGVPCRGEGSGESWEAWFPTRIRSMISRGHRNVPERAEEIRRAQRWFEERGHLARGLAPYQLVHGDLNLGNMFVSEEGEIGVIDFGEMAYQPFEIDLARLEMVFANRLDSLALVFDEYFAHVPHERRERWGRTADLFRAYLLCRRAVSSWRRSNRKGETEIGRQRFERAENTWATLMAFVEASESTSAAAPILPAEIAALFDPKPMFTGQSAPLP